MTPGAGLPAPVTIAVAMRLAVRAALPRPAPPAARYHCPRTEYEEPGLSLWAWDRRGACVDGPPVGKVLRSRFDGLVGCKHVSGLSMQGSCLLALMSSANEVPYRSSRFDAQLPMAD